MMLFKQFRMLRWLILLEGVQVDFFVNGTLKFVAGRVLFISEKYINFVLLPKLVTALRIGVLLIFRALRSEGIFQLWTGGNF